MHVTLLPSAASRSVACHDGCAGRSQEETAPTLSSGQQTWVFPVRPIWLRNNSAPTIAARRHDPRHGELRLAPTTHRAGVPDRQAGPHPVRRHSGSCRHPPAADGACRIKAFARRHAAGRKEATFWLLTRLPIPHRKQPSQAPNRRPAAAPAPLPSPLTRPARNCLCPAPGRPAPPAAVRPLRPAVSHLPPPHHRLPRRR